MLSATWTHTSCSIASMLYCKRYHVLRCGSAQLRFVTPLVSYLLHCAQFNTNLHQWDHSKLLRANLEAALELTFPSPSTTKKEDYSADCCICYTYRLASSSSSSSNDSGDATAGAIPDRLCDNAKCRRAFHPTCLLEWLRGLPDSRTSFGTTFGACPYCSADISVKATV
jgi:E3 ubiquitin-protein ligase FANCL